MSFSQIRESILVESSKLWDLAAAKVTNIDPSTQHMVIICAAIFTLVAVCLGLGSLFQKKEAPPTAPEGTDALSGSVTILLRDLSTKLTSQAAQAREDFAFLKQEVLEIRVALTSLSHLHSVADELVEMHHSLGHLPDLEKQVENLNARIASYSNLMREEFSILREEILNGKLVSKGNPHLVGSHVVDSAEFFKQTSRVA
jgi:hypothetical protein